MHLGHPDHGKAVTEHREHRASALRRAAAARSYAARRALRRGGEQQ